MTSPIEEHPIQFLRTELMDFAERMRWVGTDEDRVRRAIDLSCENILEHVKQQTIKARMEELSSVFHVDHDNLGTTIKGEDTDYVWVKHRIEELKQQLNSQEGEENKMSEGIVSGGDSRSLGTKRLLAFEPFDFVEPCEPECTKERHAYHQGQWDMAVRLEEYLRPEEKE